MYLIKLRFLGTFDPDCEKCTYAKTGTKRKKTTEISFSIMTKKTASVNGDVFMKNFSVYFT